MSVVWYVPNLVGYFRILFTIIAVFLLFHDPAIAIFLGFISQILDAADGTLARHFGQCSALGIILDYTVDRMFVGCWMIVLTVLYPHLWFLFMFVLSFDLVSHLFHMFASMQQGKNSHKEQDEQQGPLLKLYYSNRIFMFVICLLHDLWILAMVLYYFYPSLGALVGIIVCVPFVIFKAYIHLIQLISASRSLIHLHSLNFSPD